MRDFFWWCAGVHQETLRRYPQSHSKYVSIGATVFFTGIFAALAGGYALYFVFSGSSYSLLYALIFGLMWGLAIFNLDRYIVLSLNKNASTAKQLLQALPRIILAVLIGLVISRPLELKIFDKEIRSHLRSAYLVNQQAAIDTINSTFAQKYQSEYHQLNRLKGEADSTDTRLKQERQQLNHEIFGTKTLETSGVMGYGPYAKRKDESLQKQERHLDTLKASIIRQEALLAQRKQQEGLMSQRIHSDASLDSLINLAGFADRNAALSNLHLKADGSEEDATRYAVLFITFLFVFFECLPVLVKLMSQRDSYDRALESQQQIDDYETVTLVEVEKSALEQLHGERIASSIARRRQQLHADAEN